MNKKTNVIPFNINKLFDFNHEIEENIILCNLFFN